MAITSDRLAITLQALDDNPDTWGTILNDSTIQLIESAFFTTTVDVTAADVTLDTTQGGDAAEHYRYGILDIQGTSLATPRNVNLPPDVKNTAFIKKAWLVINNTTGGQVVTFKTTTGTGISIPAGEGQWMFCDGTDILAASASTATTAATATTALDSDALTGVAGANFAQKALAQTFTAGQVSERVVQTNAQLAAGLDCSLSNAFYHLTTGAINMGAPSNATTGQQFSLVIEQGVNAPHAITFASTTFIAPGGAPVLSLALGEIDYLGFEYVTGLSALGGSRWMVSILKNLVAA